MGAGHGGFDVRDVGIAGGHDFLRQAVRAPEDEGAGACLTRKRRGRSADALGERHEIVGGIEPAVDGEERAPIPARFAQARELLHARAGGGSASNAERG